MNRRKPKPKRACKFPGMTADQYDANVKALLGMATRRAMILTPDVLNKLMPLTSHGTPQFVELDDDAMYRRAPKARGQREAARRLRQASARGR